MSALRAYLEELHRIRGSGVATDEKSYYPALDVLFKAVGETLTPPVAPVHETKDLGAGHPDFLLEVPASHDLRAAVEAKGPGVSLDELARSEQVKRYLTLHDPTLITNLRDFALVRLGKDGQPEIFMRHTLAGSENDLWQTPVAALVRAHERDLTEFLASALSWSATLTRPRDLAQALARYARVALSALEREQGDALTPLRKALEDALGLRFTDEQGEHFFHSSLVQTLFYGLFSAWVVWNRKAGPKADPKEFRWQLASDYLSLPVLRELFETVAQPGKLQDLGVRQPLEWAEATLRRTNWGLFAAAFDESDAVNYFYEPFLEAYDPELREQLGVWYTPREIIRYQVARVDRLLREELGKPLGLADRDVLILDPATGTGGYLLEALRVIDHTLRDPNQGGAGATRAMLLRHAASHRVFGFEILPAPFVVAHLQMTTLLASLGAPLESGQRAGVYLTNSLTGWKQAEDLTSGERRAVEQKHFEGYPRLKEEVDAAARVKRSASILVVLGNPPYNGFAGVAEEEEQELLAPYYVGLKERFDVQPRAINDLYIRFFRLAERQIAETTGRGIVSYISNYGWLTGLSHPVMRERLLRGFDKVWIDNLHGDRIISERTPNGNSSETIFAVRGQGAGIKVGTAVTTLVRMPQHSGETSDVYYRDVWGMPDDLPTWGRAARVREALEWSAALPSNQLANMYTRLQPDARARYTLRPGGGEEAYHTWPSLPQMFARYFPGFKTSRDADLVSIDREPLEARMRAYFDPTRADAQVAEVAPVLMKDASRYEASATRRELLRTSGFHEERITRVAYRPLDDRWLYYEPTTKLLDEKRADFYEQVFPDNLYLSTSMQSRREPNMPVVTSHFGSLHLQDPYSLYFPLYVRETQGALFAGSKPHVNVRPEILDILLGRQALAGSEEEREATGIALFYHTFAIAHAPDYKRENYGPLMGDWPRVPIPATREALEASAALGRCVAALLRPDMPFAPAPELVPLGQPARVDGGQLSGGDLRVTVRYSSTGRYEPPSEAAGAHGGRLWWNDDCYWDNVSPNVWAFTLGGYPVIKKWLDYRHESKLKRPLRLEEVLYVQEMVQRIASLLALGPVLDANYAAVKADTLPLDLSRLGKPMLTMSGADEAE
jgi:hypothetical protein